MKPKQGLGAFWRELRRRHVVRAGGVYVAAAFVVLQLGEIVLPAFNAPDWVLQSLVVAAFLGLPVVLAFAWVYDLTPEGLAKTRQSPGGVKVTMAPRLALLVVTSISVALGLVWFQRSAATGDASAGTDAAPAAAVRFASLDPDAPITAIAVLPLADFAEGDDLFARQLHEEIITQLSLITSLRIVSRTSVERYADSDMLLPEIAAELGVQAVVTGSVAMTSESDSVRITLQLLHAATDTHMLSRTFQREMKDILRLQTEVAVEIATTVQGELGEQLIDEVEQVAEVDPEAYRAFLQGKSELEQRTPGGLQAALASFDRSAALDPSFSLPVAWRAGVRLMQFPNRDSVPPELLAQVLEDVRRAEALGGAEDEVAAARVVLFDQIGAGFAGVNAEVVEGVEATAEVARFVEAAGDSLRRRYLLESTRFGRRLGRGSPVVEGHRLLNEGRYDSAAVVFTAIVEADPNVAPAWSGLEEAHLLQGNHAGAVGVREQRILATQGETPDAAASIEALHETFEEDDPASYWRWRQEHNEGLVARGERVSDVEMAATALGLGDHGAALAHLEAAVRNRDPALVSLMTSSMWDPLRSDPRFTDIVRRARELWRRGGGPRAGEGAPDRPNTPGRPPPR
ncbi:MAG: hypothetical protein OXN18_13615 [Gemmatimonadota bacterium]|nr:hypothetical protein [Gemmatimonadota bacterium]